MDLKSVQVRSFRNIVDTGPVDIDPSVTCLVGKNESGKTSFLHALHRLLPARGTFEFSVPDHYPAWLEKRDRMKGKVLEDVTPVSATFQLTEKELDDLRATYGKDTLEDGTSISVSRKYDGTLAYGVSLSESSFVDHIVNSLDWARGTKTKANGIKTIAGLRKYAEELQQDEEADKVETGETLASTLTSRIGEEDNLSRAVWRQIKQWLPRFLYFDEYSALPYSTKVEKVLTTDPSDLDESELTARALLTLAGAESEYLTNADYERRKRELENVANAITSDVLKYWSQNPELRVQPDITQKTEQRESGQHAVIDELKIRVWDNRHQLSLPFDQHSTGFRWFFSFLAAFSEFEYSEAPIVLLLDEPALGLHARAQADFLRFIDERLAPKRQVVYTTHSPFMVQPGQLERVRLVEDKSVELGAVVTSDVATTDPDTLFPLQGALGYDLAQHLFIGNHNLVVEGTSDFTYMQVISDHFRAIGDREPLDERWTVVPVGGADLVPTFVALLGGHLDLTVLVDAKRGGHQKLNHLVAQSLLQDKRLLTIGTVTGQPEADIEDLFAESDYISLFNQAFNTSISATDLTGSDPMVKRIARHRGEDRFDHGRPADFFLRKRDEILPSLSADTLDLFEDLFQRINSTLVES